MSNLFVIVEFQETGIHRVHGIGNHCFFHSHLNDINSQINKSYVCVCVGGVFPSDQEWVKELQSLQTLPEKQRTDTDAAVVCAGFGKG